jgi:hypothetical protein
LIASLDLDRGVWFLVVCESYSRHPVPVTGVASHSLDQAGKSDAICLSDNKIGNEFFFRNNFLFENSEMENGKWEMESVFHSISHFPFPIFRF